MAGVEDMDHKLNVAIIGGGWSGLAAAVTLAEHATITVFEAAPVLGGRARGLSNHGLQLDNGQHILLGAYRETLRLMALVGVDTDDALLRLPLQLEFPQQLSFATPKLPAPYHLISGLLSASGLGWKERLSAIRLMTQLKLSDFKTTPKQTVADLLSNQPTKVVRLLWEPLCLAALNTPIRSACAQTFINVLRDSFTKTRADSDLLLPRRDLGMLFPYAAKHYLERAGSKIRLGSRVNDIGPDRQSVSINGEIFDAVICAVGPHSAVKLLSGLPEIAATQAQIAALQYQPITTVYLQYPVNVSLSFPMLGLTRGYGQWVFDRGMLCGQHGLLSIIISAEGPHTALNQDELAGIIHHELQTTLGSLPQPQWHQVISEKRATFACTAGLQRPEHQTSHPRFWLAGDYTAGDYPATLEGAVRSGVKCAQLLLAQLQ